MIAQGIDTRSAIDAKRRGPKGESPVGLPMRPNSVVDAPNPQEKMTITQEQSNDDD